MHLSRLMHNALLHSIEVLKSEEFSIVPSYCKHKSVQTSNHRFVDLSRLLLPKYELYSKTSQTNQSL